MNRGQRRAQDKNGVKPETPQAITLPDATRRRIAQAVAAHQQAQAAVQNLVVVAAEALGVEGEILGYNADTGVVTYRPLLALNAIADLVQEPTDA